jgi:hypothetical protein
MSNYPRDNENPIPLAYSNIEEEPAPEPRYYDGQLRVIFFIGGLLLLAASVFLPNLFWSYDGLIWNLLRFTVSAIPFVAGFAMILHSFQTWRRPWR